jgi:hypothetical protein
MQQLFRLMLWALPWVLSSPLSARAEAPTKELDTYLVTSGMKQITLDAHQMSVDRAFKQGVLSATAADCYRSSQITDAYVEEVLKPLAAGSFSSAELVAVNAFNATDAGRKIVQDTIKRQNLTLASLFYGGDPPPFEPVKLSSKEADEIRSWEASPHFSSVARYEAVLRGIRSTQEFKRWQSASEARCAQ